MDKPVITFFIYSEGLNGEEIKGAPGFEDYKRLNIIGAQTMLRPAYIPGQYSFNASVGLRGVNGTGQHTLRMEFGTEDNVIVNTGNMPMLSDFSFDDQLPLEESGVVVGVAFNNVVFKAPGWYWTKVYLNNELLGVFEVPVREGRKA